MKYGYGFYGLRPLSDFTANCRPVLSSERAPYMKKKLERKKESRKLKSGHGPQKGGLPDTKVD
jgi:hypothetical protein